MRWAGHVALMGRREVYRVLVGKPEGKKPLERSRCRLDDNIKIDIQEVGWASWAGLIWLRVVTVCVHLKIR